MIIRPSYMAFPTIAPEHRASARSMEIIYIADTAAGNEMQPGEFFENVFIQIK